MCGIVAILGQEKNPSREAVARGLKSIHHRGPDASRIWKSDGGHAILGHKRLSILDLNTGDQPLTNEDKTLHVVVNGELYGFEEIRKDLETRGHCFRTRSDSEIVLHLYEEYGPACVSHLRGEFSFVLWDEKKRTLFAARDRFGIKPLFYSHSNGQLSFASEVKALHAIGIEAGWNEDVLVQMLGLHSSNSGKSKFRHIKTVPPGHYIVANRENVTVTQYWDFDFPREGELDVLPDREYAEKFRSLLDESVRIRMRADVPVGCYLSGGIDSCSILALMARFSSSPVRAFTLKFDNPALDESILAQEMASHAGTACDIIPVSQADLADNFSDAIWHAETIFANPHGVAKFLLSRAVRNAGYKVVLTGEGADEIVAGYPHFSQDFSRSSGADTDSMRLLPEKNTDPRAILPTDDRVSLLLMERLGYFPAFLDPLQEIGRKIADFFQVSAPFDKILLSCLDDMNIVGQLKGRHAVNQSLYLWNKTYLPEYILTTLGDRMEMAHSVEGRVPFLDHHLVEFTRSLPVKQKINGTIEKFVLREAMRPFLPQAAYERKKHTFVAPPLLSKADTPLHMMMQDTLRGGALNRIPLVDKKAVARILDVLPRLDADAKAVWEIPLMELFSAAVLADKFHL
ncbi:MAG: asparagine synthase (glutamine-hydrolyzing) [Edaphobacter sp.]|nr:asparagine synthase (glutamine-hydrolyzing) [Edaphobacter sp.]